MQLGRSRMRINCQLVDTETGNRVWAERFDKPIADLFDMQDEIGASLANELGTELVSAEAARRVGTGRGFNSPKNHGRIITAAPRFHTARVHS